MAALIGPNAVLQLLPLIDLRLLGEAGLAAPPSDHGLMAEEPAHRLHRAGHPPGIRPGQKF